MALLNAHWYSTNEGLSYPVDAAATCIDDAGLRLPSNIITDLQLRWPSIYGRYCFLASVTVTSRVVSLTFVGAADLDAAGDFVPLAVVTVVFDGTESQGRQVAVEPQASGVGGWVVFGSGLGTAYRGRFSTPRQSYLTARAGRAYRLPPVEGLRALQAEQILSGVVALRASSPLEVVKESRVIDGKLKDCAVVRLVDTSTLSGVTTDGLKATNVFREFSGPCAGRPESNTCGTPLPIEFVNAVGPDCDGVLIIEITGGVNIAQAEGCGLVIDSGVGIGDTCLPPAIPATDGKLPSEAGLPDVPVYVPPVDPPDTTSASIDDFVGLPYLVCFDVPDYFGVLTGHFGLSFDPSDVDSECGSNIYAADDQAHRNIALWVGPDTSTLGRRVSVHFRMTPGLPRVNAGLVINFQVTEGGQFLYYLGEYNYLTQELILSRFNGTTTAVVASVSVPLSPTAWYKLTVETAPGPGSITYLQVRLQSLSVGTVDVTIGPVGVTGFLPATGHFGVHADRAVTRFNSFLLELNS